MQDSQSVSEQHRRLLVDLMPKCLPKFRASLELMSVEQRTQHWDYLFQRWPRVLSVYSAEGDVTVSAPSWFVYTYVLKSGKHQPTSTASINRRLSAMALGGMRTQATPNRFLIPLA